MVDFKNVTFSEYLDFNEKGFSIKTNTLKKILRKGPQILLFAANLTTKLMLLWNS